MHTQAKHVTLDILHSMSGMFSSLHRQQLCILQPWKTITVKFAAFKCYQFQNDHGMFWSFQRLLIGPSKTCTAKHTSKMITKFFADRTVLFTLLCVLAFQDNLYNFTWSQSPCILQPSETITGHFAAIKDYAVLFATLKTVYVFLQSSNTFKCTTHHGAFKDCH